MRCDAPTLLTMIREMGSRYGRHLAGWEFIEWFVTADPMRGGLIIRLRALNGHVGRDLLARDITRRLQTTPLDGSALVREAQEKVHEMLDEIGCTEIVDVGPPTPLPTFRIATWGAKRLTSRKAA